MDEVERELQLLRGFGDSRLRKNSFVYNKVQDLIAQAQREHLHIKESQTVLQAQPIDKFRVNIFINHPSIKEGKVLTLDRGSSLASLKHALETTPEMLPAGHSVERVLVRRTGKAWSQLDDKTIEQCEIKDGDGLVIECKSNLNMDVSAARGVDRIAASGATVASPFQFLCLALHCFVLDMSFFTVVELPSTVPGFAPAVKSKIRFILFIIDFNLSV